MKNNLKKTFKINLSLLKMKYNKCFIMKLFFIVPICVMLSSCGEKDSFVPLLGSLSSFSKAKVWLEKVKFVASNDLNNNSPVLVHIVIAYKPELLADLTKMDSEKYFKQLPQTRSDNGDNIDIFEFDIIPGQTKESKIEPSKLSGEGVLVFARYESNGEHRAAIGPDAEVKIEMNKLDFKVSPIKPG